MAAWRSIIFGFGGLLMIWGLSVFIGRNVLWGDIDAVPRELSLQLVNPLWFVIGVATWTVVAVLMWKTTSQAVVEPGRSYFLDRRNLVNSSPAELRVGRARRSVLTRNLLFSAATGPWTPSVARHSRFQALRTQPRTCQRGRR